MGFLAWLERALQAGEKGDPATRDGLPWWVLGLGLIRVGVGVCLFGPRTEPQLGTSTPTNTTTNNPQTKTRPLTEASIATKLEEFRSRQPQFVSLSFATISAVDANGACVCGLVC